MPYFYENTYCESIVFNDKHKVVAAIKVAPAAGEDLEIWEFAQLLGN